MSLRFVYGRSGSGKSQYCLNDIKEKARLQDGSQLILVVPEQYSLQAERDLVRAVDAGGSLNTQVLSFRRMAYRVFNEVGGLTTPRINAAGKAMIIYKIMEEHKKSFRVFSRAADKQGFVNTVSALITEFKRYNITSDVLDSAGELISDNNLLKQKLRELAIIYQEFNKAVDERYRDMDDELTILAEKLDGTVLFDDTEIWIDAFSGFTPQEYRIIEKLLLKSRRISICICTDCLVDREMENTDIFSPVKASVKRLMALARDNNITIDKPVNMNGKAQSRFSDSSELAHLERNFFSFPYERYIGKTRDVKLFSSVNIYSEIEYAARDILCLCRDYGIRYRDIAVVTGNLSNYEKLITAIFSEYGISFFVDKKRDITNHPMIQLVLSLFDILLSRWSYESVFRYLKTGLSGIGREEIDVIENYVLACGIKGAKWYQENDWSYYMDSSSEDEGERERDTLIRINEIRQRVIEPVLKFRSAVKGRNKAIDICSSVYVFLCDINVPETIENRIEGFREKGQLNLANEYGQIWNMLMELLDHVVDIMGDEILSVEKFSNLLKVGLGEYKMGLIPPALDQIQIGSIDRSINHEVKALYVLGVNDGIFPSAGMDEGVLSDRDRDELKDLGLEIANDTRTNAFHEQYLVYKTLTTAGKYLRISFPIADHEGRTMRPSIIISRLRKIFSGLTESSNIIKPDSEEGELELVTRPVPTFNELVAVLRRQSEGAAISPVWMDIYGWYKSQKDWNMKCDAAKSALGYTNQVQPIPNEKVRKLYGSPIYSSVSRLEGYTSCPFAYYVEYGLKARERKIFRLTMPDVGTFLHAVIERFSHHVAKEGLSWRELDAEYCSQVITEIVDNYLDEMKGDIFNSSNRYRNLACRLKRVVARSIRLIVEHIKRSSFNPVGFEMDFGKGGHFPPIEVKLSSGGSIYLTGRIDRIDAYETGDGTYLRIVDYKSGNKAFRLSDAYYGLQIQLITYLDAIWENEGGKFKEPVLPGGILYFHIDDPIINGSRHATEEEVEKAIMKQLRMKGLLLADVKLIKEMDHDISGNSLIIPARLNKGDVLGKSSVASLEQFQIMRRYIRKLMDRIGEEIIKGDVSIKPYKNKKTTPCQYCSYSPVCQFDPVLKDNQYRIIHDLGEEEVWGLMNMEPAGKDDGKNG